MTEHKTISTTASTTTPTGGNNSTSGVTTREQHRRNNAEQDAVEDSERTESKDTSKKEKDKHGFKGKVEKMDGNVFQLPEESKKGNQCSSHGYADRVQPATCGYTFYQAGE